MADYKDFQEIAHCGGKETLHVTADANGNRSFAVGFIQDAPGPASVVGIYVLLPQGTPIADFSLGGIGPAPDSLPGNAMPILLGSDSHGCWGHQCRRCKGYFRNGVHPAIYPLTCPYCALRAAGHQFLTPAQLKYIGHCATTLIDALNSDMAPNTEKEIVIDMDVKANEGREPLRPDFYYASETQQTQYKCSKCNEFNDIRGIYGYCVACGWRNNLAAVKEVFAKLRSSLNDRAHSPENTVKLAISEYDACCRDFVTQICRRIAMKPGRKAHLQRALFHDIDSDALELLKSMFDVDLRRDIEDVPFVRMMMHRRHVFEHNAGVADQRYLDLSGDTSV
jgi:hypothetical protein